MNTKKRTILIFHVFNINNEVKFKLTDYGKELIQTNSKLAKVFTPFHLPDTDGYYRCQLHCLILYFGQYMHGGRAILKDNILIFPV